MSGMINLKEIKFGKKDMVLLYHNFLTIYLVLVVQVLVTENLNGLPLVLLIILLLLFSFLYLINHTAIIQIYFKTDKQLKDQDKKFKKEIKSIEKLK